MYLAMLAKVRASFFCRVSVILDNGIYFNLTIFLLFNQDIGQHST